MISTVFFSSLSLSGASPVSVGNTPDKRIEAGSSFVRFSVRSYFTMSGSAVTYSARSLHETVASVDGEMCGSMLKVIARSQGTASIAVTASANGMSETDTLTVEVDPNAVFVPSTSNSAPVAQGTIPDTTFTQVTSSISFVVSSYFSDPDGDDLTWSAGVSPVGKVEASITDSTLTLTARMKGAAMVMVTARDLLGLEVTQSFRATITNSPPVPEGMIADTTFTQKTSPISFVASSYFSDPDPQDRNSLTWSSSSSNTGVVTTSVTDGTLALTAVSKGTATVTVTATDPSNAYTTQVFDVTIANSVPMRVGAIPDTTVAVGASLVFHVSPYFTDPDPEDRPRLRYVGTSLSRNLASANVSDSTMTIAGLSAGRARMVVLGLETPTTEVVTHYFYVTVFEQTPLSVGIIGPRLINSGVNSTWEATVTGGDQPYMYRWDYATECVADDLTRTGDSCVWRWVSASSRDSTLTRAITTAESQAAVRVTATDGSTPTAASAMDSVIVSVNHAPDTVGAIAARTIVLGHPAASFSLARFFSDPDNDILTYEAESSSDDTVGVSISGSRLTLTANLVNMMPDTVTVTVTDKGDLTATQEFAVTVENPSTDLTAYITGDNLMSIMSGTEYTWGSTVTGGTSPYTYRWSYATRCVNNNLLRDEPCMLQWTSAGTTGSLTRTITTTGNYADIRLIVSDSASPADSVTKRLRVTVTQPAGTNPVDPVTPPPIVTPNRRPVVDVEIPDQTLTAGGSLATFGLNSYFSDPDNDNLTWSASSSNGSAASASVSGSTLTITPVAQGSATVTASASDGQYTVSQSVTVTVNRATSPPVNRPPIAVGAISKRTLTLVTSPSAIFGVASFFSDPDNDELDYEALSSNEDVVDTSMSGSMLTVTADSQGAATVTVTASDPDGESATQTFAVEVPNRSPAGAGTISDRELLLVTSPSSSFGVASFFSDPDGDDLTYTASSSNASRVTASMSGGSIAIAAVSQGAATITVTATDPGNLSATQEFDVKVPNRQPVVSTEIPDTTLTVGGSSVTFNLTSYFSDPDGDDLTYRASLALTSIARARISGSTLTITPVSGGNATMNVFAEDRSSSVSQSVMVTVITAAGLSASINGPSSVTTPGSTTWTASVSGGESPYTYSWRYKQCNDEGALDRAEPVCRWISGGAESSLSLTLSESTTLELTVTDDDDDSVTVTLAVLFDL